MVIIQILQRQAGGQIDPSGGILVDLIYSIDVKLIDTERNQETKIRSKIKNKKKDSGSGHC